MMRALLITAGLFFSLFGGVLIYFAATGAGHEYDLKLVVPIDTRQMPEPDPAAEIVSQDRGAAAPDTASQGRAEAGPLAPAPGRAAFKFRDRSGAAEAYSQE